MDTLLPYTTLVRSHVADDAAASAEEVVFVHGQQCRGDRLERVQPVDQLLHDAGVAGQVQAPVAMFDHVTDIMQMTKRVALYRSEEHTSELQSLMRLSYAVFCLNQQKVIC